MKPAPISKPVLVVFSNPEDSTRLRLDREQRVLEELQRKHGPTAVFRTLTAATVDDLTRELRDDPSLRIVHFSGHGSPEGIYLETSPASATGFELSASHLASLVSSHCPKLEALILSSCYSAESSNVLMTSAPFVVTVEGPADDNAAIEFTRLFYDNFLSSRSVERSLARAQIALQALNYDLGLQIYVTRRGEELSKGRKTLQSIKSGLREETVLIDITDVELQIETLDIAKGHFLALLANKIYIHRWLYLESVDMEYAVFPIGKYFAVFSWNNGMDILTCRRILRPKSSATQDGCDAWMGLSFRYNQLFALAYRRERESIYAGMQEKLKYALDEFELCVGRFFGVEGSARDPKASRAIKEAIPDQFKLASPLINENMTAAARYLAQEEYSRVVIHLETTLSLIHGVLDGLVDAFAV
jgi:hypothetical protein